MLVNRHVQVVHDKLWPYEVAALWGIPCRVKDIPAAPHNAQATQLQEGVPFIRKEMASACPSCKPALNFFHYFMVFLWMFLCVPQHLVRCSACFAAQIISESSTVTKPHRLSSVPCLLCPRHRIIFCLDICLAAAAPYCFTSLSCSRFAADNCSIHDRPEKQKKHS